MATLYIRHVPEKLYARLKKLAESQNRTVNAQVITLIQEALDAETMRQKQAALLEAMRRDIWTPPANSPGTLEVLRETREERENERASVRD
jgi:hypothetical protein